MEDEIAKLSYIAYKCKKESKFFTKYMFRNETGEKFVVKKHHDLIFQALDKVLSGEITRLIINVPPRYGKAIDIDTDIPTVNGFVKAKDVDIGTLLYGRNGLPTAVTGVYPQGVKSAYKVTFSDNTSAICCDEHLWSVRKRYGGYVTKRTVDLINDLKCSDDRQKWQIPMMIPFRNVRCELEIDPYQLGLWLGDGSSYKAEICTMDKEVVGSFSEYGTTIRKHQNAGKATEYGIVGGFVTLLKKLNLTGNKHIPDKYLFADAYDRLRLLQGLCDSDGTVGKNGQISFSSSRKALQEGFKILVTSLGGKYTFYEKNGSQVINFRLNGIIPFTLPRHIERCGETTPKNVPRRFIKTIEKVEDREMVCFSVDSHDRLFAITKDFILTHNTELAVKKFIAQGFAINPASKFMHLSYSDDLALDNSTHVRDLLQQPFYRELFPNVQLKADSNSKKKFYTTKGGVLYATSTGGQVTGFGAGRTESKVELDWEEEVRRNFELEERLQTDDDIKEGMDEVFGSDQEKEEYEFGGALIVDDAMKPEDADSDLLRGRINDRFDSTILNRINARTTPIIVIMQRLHENDLCGHLLEEHKEKGWTVVSIPAIQKDEKGREYALWPDKHSLKELYLEREKRPHYFERQYMQSPQPVEGRMYEPFQTYETLPITKLARRKNYTDVADKGKDYLCSICYVQTEIGNYVTDLVYTKASTMNTEPMVVKLLNRNFTERARIESNNGGTIFARNVRNQLRISGNNKCFVEEFTQTKNKEARILTNRDEVNNTIIFPHNWATRWPDFHRHVTSFRAEGQNEYDDAPDAMTGIVESVKSGSGLISVFTAQANDYHNHR